MPEYFGKDWFSKNIPNWEKYLADYKERDYFRYLEIGSFEGRSVRWVLENFPRAMAISVDPFIVPDYFDKATLPDGYDLYGQFKNNLQSFEHRLQVHQRFSFDWLCEYLGRPLPEFDVIYVDGDHKAVSCLQDAVLSFRLLKVGGILIFDDYIWKKQLTKTNPTQTPKLAIDAFLEIYADYIEVLDKGRQVFIRKTKEFH